MTITKMSTRIDESQEVHDEVALNVGAFPVLYSRSGKLWRPAFASIRWRRNRVNGGEWSPWRLSATVIGPKLKKDGRDSQVEHRAVIYSWTELDREHIVPQELVTWIHGARPGDDLPQPYRRPGDDDVPAPDDRLDLDLV